MLMNMADSNYCLRWHCETMQTVTELAATALPRQASKTQRNGIHMDTAKDIVEITIETELKALWPDTCLACLVWEGHVSPEANELWAHMERNILPDLKNRLAEIPLAEMPNLAQSRKAYKAFGKDPGRLRVSSEALYRRIRQGKDLYRINSVVDVNNLISLQTGFSVGSYDISRVSGPVKLRLGREGETYDGIGKDRIDLYRLPLLSDAVGPFGSPSSDSTRTMITDACCAILTVIYGFSGTSAAQGALELAEGHIRSFSTGFVRSTGLVS